MVALRVEALVAVEALGNANRCRSDSIDIKAKRDVKMFLALLLSGFFMRPGWWMKVLLLIFVLPWDERAGLS